MPGAFEDNDSNAPRTRSPVSPESVDNITDQFRSLSVEEETPTAAPSVVSGDAELGDG